MKKELRRLLVVITPLAAVLCIGLVIADQVSFFLFGDPDGLPFAVPVAAVLNLVMVVLFAALALTNTALSNENRILWALVVVFASLVGILAYWYFNIVKGTVGPSGESGVPGAP